MGPAKNLPSLKFTGLKPRWHYNIRGTKYHPPVQIIARYTFPENYKKGVK